MGFFLLTRNRSHVSGLASATGFAVARLVLYHSGRLKRKEQLGIGNACYQNQDNLPANVLAATG